MLTLHADHAAFASLLAGRSYVGIVKNNEDAIGIKKGLDGLDEDNGHGSEDKDDNNAEN